MAFRSKMNASWVTEPVKRIVDIVHFRRDDLRVSGQLFIASMGCALRFDRML